MRSSNPVLTGRGFARIKDGTTQVQEINTLESRPTSAPMSIDDVVIKTAGLLAQALHLLASLADLFSRWSTHFLRRFVLH
jgi:hypothetical protein